MPKRKRYREYQKLARDVGRRLREVREGVGLTQQAFASEVGMVSQRTVANYEGGEVLIPSDLALEVCDFFNVSFYWLMTGQGQKDRKDYGPEPDLATDLERMRTLGLVGKVLTAGTHQERGQLVQFVDLIGRRFFDPKLAEVAKGRPKQ